MPEEQYNEEGMDNASLRRMASTRSSFVAALTPSQIFMVKKGKVDFITSKFESLDYDTCENTFLIKEEISKGFKYLVRKNLAKWFMFLLIGIFTAIVASSIDLFITNVCDLKFATLATRILFTPFPSLHFICKIYFRHRRLDFDKYEFTFSYFLPLLWILLNVVPFLIGCFLVTYVSPMAAGSGIPYVKCYLNGIQVPDVLTFRTLVVKGLGLAFSIIGGVASGKEGPMIHVGACVASIVSRGEFFWFDKRVHVSRYFRDDAERRDLVSAGAASGVSAAFGASVGGVLFSLEEGSSYWNQTLTWRIFFASIVSKFILNFILSCYYGQPGNLEHKSLINLGNFDNLVYKFYEVPVFAMMGVIGGMSGALWNYANYQLAILRLTYLKNGYLKIMEGAFVAALSAIVFYILTFYVYECGIPQRHRNKHKTKLGCSGKDGYNTMATIWMQTPQASLNSLIHDPLGTYSYKTLIAVFSANYVLSCLTFGLSSSNGIFVPTMLTGAAWGRLLAKVITYILGDPSFITPAKYALIGAAAQLGGSVRMTLSLTVIIMETSDNISFSLPIIITLMCAKFTGDFFNDGVYDIQIKLKAMPFLYSDPPPLSHSIKATHVMSTNVVCVKAKESVHYILNTVLKTSHNGFPVVDTFKDEIPRSGEIKGIILKGHLVMMLKEKMFYENRDLWLGRTTNDSIRDYYLQPTDITEFNLTRKELEYNLDIKSFMNNAPYTLLESSSLPRIYRLFRAVGLRHLPIVDTTNDVVGMITRQDLARYKVFRHKGKITMQKFEIADDFTTYTR